MKMTYLLPKANILSEYIWVGTQMSFLELLYMESIGTSCTI